MYFLHLLKLPLNKVTIEDCSGVVREIYLRYKYQWPQEDLNFESFTSSLKLLGYKTLWGRWIWST